MDKIKNLLTFFKTNWGSLIALGLSFISIIISTIVAVNQKHAAFLTLLRPINYDNTKWENKMALIIVHNYGPNIANDVKLKYIDTKFSWYKRENPLDLNTQKILQERKKAIADGPTIIPQDEEAVYKIGWGFLGDKSKLSEFPVTIEYKTLLGKFIKMSWLVQTDTGNFIQLGFLRTIKYKLKYVLAKTFFPVFKLIDWSYKFYDKFHSRPKKV